MAKILMINVPYSGHVNPTLPLAQELVKRGHEVAYINAPEWRDRIEATGAIFIPYANYPEGLTEQQKKMLCFKAAYDTAIQIGKQYDLLIYEMFFYIGKTLADRLGIPCVRQWSQPAWNEFTIKHYKKVSKLWTLSCKLIEVQVLNKKSAKEIHVEGKHMIGTIVSEIPDLNIVYLPKIFQPCSESFDNRYIFSCPTMQTIGKTGAAIPYEHMKTPIIYISMGSIISSKIFCKRCIKAFGNKNVSVILNTGRVKPESLGELPSNIHAYSFVPQLEVLQHTDLFITHGGMNSINEAMYYGVPMLVIPILNDQPLNAEQVVRLQIGKKMRAFPSSAKKLFHHAMDVLGNNQIRKNSLSVQQRIHADIRTDGIAEKIEEYLRKGNEHNTRII